MCSAFTCRLAPLLSGRFAAEQARHGLAIMRKKQHNRSKPCLILRFSIVFRYPTGILHLAITRRHLLQSGAFAAIAPALGSRNRLPGRRARRDAADRDGEPVWRHALSLFGDVKYPADFKRFDYVNPDAPKGGVARQISIGTFDNFNIAVAGVKGSIARRGRADLRNADDAVAGRGLDRIRRAGRVGQLIPMIFPG